MSSRCRPTILLRSEPRALLTPHLGYVTEETYRSFYAGMVCGHRSLARRQAGRRDHPGQAPAGSRSARCSYCFRSGQLRDPRPRRSRGHLHDVGNVRGRLHPMARRSVRTSRLLLQHPFPPPSEYSLIVNVSCSIRESSTWWRIRPSIEEVDRRGLAGRKGPHRVEVA